MKTKTENRDILLYGNAAYFTNENIRSFAEGRRTAVAGSLIRPLSDGKIRRYRKSSTEKNFAKLFRVYDFEAVIFVSGYLTFGAEPDNEIEELRRLLHQCRKYGLTRGVILTSQDLCGSVHESRRMELHFMEALCRYYADENFHIQIVRCPFLGSGVVENDYFREMLCALENGENWTFPRPADEKTNFITMGDLDTFLLRLLDKPAENVFETWDLRGYTKYTFGAFAGKLEKDYPGSRIRCNEKAAADTLTYGEDLAGERLGWLAREDAADHFPEIESEYRKHPKARKTKREILIEKLKGKRWILTGIELIGGAAIMELLNRLLQNSVQFRMIDVRLLYVVLMSSVYGMKAGSIAAILSCISLAGAYFSRGIGAVMLFYQPDNWLPFILFLTAAAVCGLTRDRREEEKQSLSDRIEELGRENAYTDALYEEAIRYKREYRENLMRSRDGFGRIFDVVQKLAASEPTKIYGAAVGVMEDVLDSDSVAIYSISETEKGYARLEVSSRKLTATLKKSVRLADYPEISRILGENQVWVNRQLRKDLPAFAAGIYAEGDLRVVICIYEAEYGQMNSYYVNLIRVLCGLVRNFILEAWSYQKATEEKNHIAGTAFVKEAFFRKELQLHRDLASRGLASYSLIRIIGEGKSAKQMDAALRGQIRDGDWVAMDESTGDFYVLAPQMDQKNGIILERLRKCGLTCEAVESRGGAA